MTQRSVERPCGAPVETPGNRAGLSASGWDGALALIGATDGTGVRLDAVLILLCMVPY